MRLFHEPLEAVFLRRPNRFIIIAETSEGLVTAHCPNPGRLQEILIPGKRVLLEKSQNPQRKTKYSLAGAYYKGKVIPMNSVKANAAAEILFLPKLFPDAQMIRKEYSLGKSRFDFFIVKGKSKILIEVKACTLVYEGTAMFPDAPTERGTRHVLELKSFADKGYEAVVLFVIMHGDACRFVPHIHTDPVFSAALAEASEKISVKAVSLATDKEGRISPVKYSVPVDLTQVDFIRKNQGIYLLHCILSKNISLCIGSLGNIQFKAGHYIYAGSAMGNLKERISRHCRKKKKKHWHIDYFLEHADKVVPYPVYASGKIECEAADIMRNLCDNQIPSFGCTDCSCESHFFYFDSNPFFREEFMDALLHLRHTLALQPTVI